MSSRQRVRAGLSLIAVLAGLPALALGQEPSTRSRQDARPLDEQVVVDLVQKHNPELKATMARLESSTESVSGLVERYAPVVQIDASASDVTNPSLSAIGVNFNRRRSIDLAAELRKHLVWGTDLSLRLSGQAFTSEVIRPPVPLNTEAGMSGMTPSVGNLLFPRKLGPGYMMIAKLTLKQPLLRGFGRDVAEADLNAARVERGAAEYTRERIASELLRDALTAYWELWYADAALAIQQAAQEVAAKQRDDAQRRVDTGTLAPVEVLAFETELAARAEEVVSAEAERKRAELELVRLLGGAAAALTVDEAAPAGWISEGAAALEERALANSAEVRERAAALEVAHVRARTASEAQRQRLDLDSYLQFQGLSTDHPGDALAAYGRDHAVSGFVGLTYETPVNRRAERAAAGKARADVTAAEQDLAAARQRIAAETRKAHERAAAQEQGVTLADQTRSIAERQLGAEQARFQSGTGTTLQVIQAEDKLRAAKLRVARARANLAQTALLLSHLTGGLLARWAQR
jgi:outer membrane protein